METGRRQRGFVKDAANICILKAYFLDLTTVLWNCFVLMQLMQKYIFNQEVAIEHAVTRQIRS